MIAIVYFITALITDDSVKLWASVAIGTTTYAYLIYALWSKNRLNPIKGHCQVRMDEEKVECTYDNGQKYTILWEDVNKISVRKIESKDPAIAAEVWLRLHSYPWRKVFTIPSSASGFEALHNHLSDWDNFDVYKVAEAKNTQPPVNWTIWERSDK